MLHGQIACDKVLMVKSNTNRRVKKVEMQIINLKGTWGIQDKPLDTNDN